MNLSLPALAQAARRRITIERHALVELKRLKPPAEVAASYSKMIVYNQAALRQVVKLYERARAGDAAGAHLAKDELEEESLHPLVAAVNARLKYCATIE